MNPLFQALGGARTAPAGQTGISPGGGMDERMSQIMANPAGMLRQAGYSVPEEISGNPQATVMHLLRTGQIGGAAMQRIQPILNMLGVR